MAAGLDRHNRALPSAGMTQPRRRTAAGGLMLLSRAVSKTLQPIHLAIAVPVLIGAHAEGVAGAAWGMIPALTAGVIPYLDARRRRAHIGGKSARQVGLAGVSILGGLAITSVAVALDAAPVAVLATGAALLAILIVIASISAVARALPHPAPLATGRSWWNGDISVHSSTAAGCAMVCFVEFGSHPAAGLGLAMLAAAVAWSRVQQREHTIAESLAGLVAGGLVCWVVVTLIT